MGAAKDAKTAGFAAGVSKGFAAEAAKACKEAVDACQGAQIAQNMMLKQSVRREQQVPPSSPSPLIHFNLTLTNLQLPYSMCRP